MFGSREGSVAHLGGRLGCSLACACAKIIVAFDKFWFEVMKQAQHIFAYEHLTVARYACANSKCQNADLSCNLCGNVAGDHL